MKATLKDLAADSSTLSHFYYEILWSIIVREIK